MYQKSSVYVVSLVYKNSSEIPFDIIKKTSISSRELILSNGSQFFTFDSAPTQTVFPNPLIVPTQVDSSGVSIFDAVNVSQVIDPFKKFIIIRFWFLSVITPEQISLLIATSLLNVHCPVIVSFWDLIPKSVECLPSNKSALRFVTKTELGIEKNGPDPLNMILSEIYNRSNDNSEASIDNGTLV